jgi:CheY-like chemotaxis protein
MRLTVRAKLLAVVGTAALAFLLLIAAGAMIDGRVHDQLAAIQSRYVPKVELGPRLEAQFEHIQRGLQDSVAAQDAEALAETRAIVETFYRELGSARDAVNERDAATLREAVEDYYSTAHAVSQRLIANETGEAMVEAIAAMQAKHARAEHLITTTTSFDRAQLDEAFVAAARAQVAAGRLRLGISLGFLALVALLSLSISRGLLRSLGALTSGFARFGTGDLAASIAVTSDDELAEVARHANQMAGGLRLLGEQRDRTDWQRQGQVGLSERVGGELAAAEVATRAAEFVASYVAAPVAALYYKDGDSLRLLGQHAVSTRGGEIVPAFRLGEGLVGEAARREDISVVSDPPADYMRIRSGVGDAAPRSIILVPLVHAGSVRGVLELATFRPWAEPLRELLASLRPIITMALEMALARAATQKLLTETQRQAERLAMQEEELRSTNDELQAQQEELRQTNEELTHQTDELEAQRQTLQKQNLELEEVRERLEHKARELSTVSAYKSQFLTNMSHELRTPLNSMLLLSSLLGDNESKNLSDKQVEFARTIHSAGRDLLALINQVLDLAKVESGKQEVNYAQVEIAELALRAKRVFSPLARDKGLALVIEVSPDLPASITTDHQRVDQVLTNLLGNAIKFTERGQVSLRIGRPPPGVRFNRADLDRERAVAFVVADTGVGIAREHRERVFMPFEQVEAAADRRYGGTGLGLSIARELTALLGGELQLESEVGKGSTFTCYLPFERAVTRGPARAVAAAGQIAAAEGYEPYLLIIEDDPIFARTFGEIIASQGLRCEIAGDGQTGLRLARERPPRGIILDVKLPDVDGWKVMDELQADARTAKIPVHFISAVPAEERGIALGAVGYLTKPVSRADLVRVIETLTPVRVDGASPILIIEDDSATGESLVQWLAAEKLQARYVSRGHDALEAVKRETFSCIILDLTLPDIDGVALLHALRDACGAKMPAVVVHTARALSKDEARQLEAFTEAVVLKEGSSFDRLIAEIRLFIRRLEEGQAMRRPTTPRLHPKDVHLEGKRILLVDDDMRTVYALSAMLQAKGVVVLTADTGRAALDVLAKHPEVDAVLMDIMMPEMDGYEAMRRIRAEARFKKLPIIALTAKAMKGDHEKCIEAGATDYLPKPVDASRLLVMLQSRLGEGGDKDDSGRAKR